MLRDAAIRNGVEVRARWYTEAIKFQVCGPARQRAWCRSVTSGCDFLCQTPGDRQFKLERQRGRADDGDSDRLVQRERLVRESLFGGWRAISGEAGWLKTAKGEERDESEGLAGR